MAVDLKVVDLDFDNIKENLKTFLQSQDYFTDYDFEGSALSILMDLLAYDTHYKAYLANMVINERFLDSAIKRASVVSHTKPLGYVPRSYTAPRAIVNITVYGISDTYTMNMERYTQFSSSIDGTSYTFVNTQAYSTIPSGDYNAYTFSNVELYEGTPVTYNYSVTSSDPNQLFKIPSLQVDTSTLRVVIQNSSTDTTSNVYTYADSISLLDSDSLVYFLEEGSDGYFYVYFGDDILGKAIQSGNIIKLSYVITNGDAANTSDLYTQTFTLEGTIGGYSASNVIIELVSASSGGGAKQTIDDIRFLAPKNYSAQGRAVTTDDYKALLMKNFPEIESIEVWGGEENVPPIYGKVFIAIKPQNSFSLGSSSKTQMTTFLKKNSIVTLHPEFVDPDFTFITIVNNIRYNSNLTTKSSSEIAESASSIISEFFKSSLQQFNKKLYISKLQTAIDICDPSILGNTINIGLQKRIEPVLSLNASYTLYYNNKIVPYSVKSTAFNILSSSGSTLTVAVKDVPNTTPPDNSGSGTMVMYNISTNEIISSNIGNVNYATGVVVLKGITVIGYPSSALYDIRVNCTPQDNIDELSTSILLEQSTSASTPTPMQNQILMLDDSTAVTEYLLNNGVTIVATPV